MQQDMSAFSDSIERAVSYSKNSKFKLEKSKYRELYEFVDTKSSPVNILTNYKSNSKCKQIAQINKIKE